MSLKLLKSTSIVAFMTILSRILGFLRDVIFAQLFGASAGFDAFVIAFKIPNLLRRLFAEGAFSQAFIPVLSDYRAKQPHADVQSLISHVSANLGLITLIVVIIVELTAPFAVMLFAPGFRHDPTRLALTTQMLHWTFPYLFFITLVALSGAILNTYQRFSLPAFTPVLLNLSLIGVATLWVPHSSRPTVTLSMGVLLGGMVQLIIQGPALWRIRCLIWPRIHWSHPGVKRILKLMIPALFGVSVAQLGLMIDNFFASYLPHGSISWLYYSDRLTYLPLGVIGVAISTVVMPHLSRGHALKKNEQYQAILNWGLKMVVLLGLPATLGLSLLSGPLLATLIHHGAFGTHDVIMTQKSLVAFSFGLLAFMLVKVLASAFYAKEMIRVPVKIASICLIINILLNFLFIGRLAHAGLALATAMAAWINALLMLFFLHRSRIYRIPKGFGKKTLPLIIASIGMAAFLYQMPRPLTWWLQASWWQGALYLCALIISAIVIYMGLLYVCGMRFSMLKPPEDT